MAAWRRMDSAPQTGERILILTSDFGIVTGWWDAEVTNFYKSQVGWASYDPESMQGDWVSDARFGEGPDRRLYCGASPCYWKPVGKLPKRDDGFTTWF
jgi:hypothetical protein